MAGRVYLFVAQRGPGWSFRAPEELFARIAGAPGLPALSRRAFVVGTVSRRRGGGVVLSSRLESCPAIIKAGICRKSNRTRRRAAAFIAAAGGEIISPSPEPYALPKISVARPSYRHARRLRQKKLEHALHGEHQRKLTHHPAGSSRVIVRARR